MISDQKMAYPPYFSNNLSLLLGFILPLFLVLSFAFIVPPILKRIVYEKETGVKELMKLMGLPSWMHWLCWFLNCAATSAVSILIMVILVSCQFKAGTGAVLAYSNPVMTFIFLFFYASALVCFLFIISTFFDRREDFQFLNDWPTVSLLQPTLPWLWEFWFTFSPSSFLITSSTGLMTVTQTSLSSTKCSWRQSPTSI